MTGDICTHSRTGHTHDLGSRREGNAENEGDTSSSPLVDKFSLEKDLWNGGPITELFDSLSDFFIRQHVVTLKFNVVHPEVNNSFLVNVDFLFTSLSAPQHC